MFGTIPNKFIGLLLKAIKTFHENLLHPVLNQSNLTQVSFEKKDFT